ncbi:MAG: hypothetical protein IAE85_13920 [Anaerolinea sp.]|nr:hypothetical protein [Anaerolinea sp.]
MTDKLIGAYELEVFLQRLGQCFRHPATLYLVGGSSLLLAAGKTSTFDIDLQFTTDDQHHSEFIRCLRTVSRELGVPVELASPEQFIPLPAGFQDRRRFVGHYGALDVFHFDFYSMALAKIHRGNEKDFDDVLQMIRAGLIEIAALEAFMLEILPEYEFYQPNADPALYRRKFDLLKTELAAQQP